MMKRMKKIVLCLLLMLAVTSLSSCKTDEGVSDEKKEVGAEAQNDAAKMTATVTSTSEEKRLEVNVISGDYGAQGVFWVLVSDQSAFYGKNGETIAREDIKAGDTVEIRYSGQVMLSYPPQIVAYSITLCQ